MSTIQIVQNYSIFNLFLLDPEAKAHMKNIIIESICDSELKVRQSACVALTGMIHSNFVNASDELIVRTSIKIEFFYYSYLFLYLEDSFQNSSQNKNKNKK